jgi:hypothetical protein
MMPVEIDATAIWTLSPDRRSIRLTLQRLPLANMAQPLALPSPSSLKDNAE